MPLVLQPAPPFRVRALLPAGAERELTLADFAGRWLVLAFYSRDFTAVCPLEVLELSKRAPELDALGASILAISVDEIDTHRRWIAEALGPLAIPLGADPAREAARAYGALLEPQGFTARATFVVDPAGILRHASYGDPAVARSISEILRVVEALRADASASARRGPGEGPSAGGPRGPTAA